MPKFRKKPVVVTAEQYLDTNRKRGILPSGVTICPWKGIENIVDGDYPTITTLEGPHIVRNGDWIITGVNGEKYPCKPDIFEKTYEPAE